MAMTDAEIDAGHKAISWFTWNFKRFKDEGLKWQVAYAKAVDKTLEQLDAEKKSNGD